MTATTRFAAPVPRAALGCMRLSTEPDRDDDRSLSVLHAAFDAGITFLDTADAYCHGADDAGHNERLIARAVASWTGERTRIRVATKCGLTRPQSGWVPDGRARHLIAACEASQRALGVERIHLYQLHAPDPRTPLSTSVRALAALKRDGCIESIGLCNVNVGQIEEARRITEIDAIQIELSVWKDENLLNGVAGYCVAHDIPLLAYRPIGGLQRRHRTLTEPLLADLAARHGATPFEIAIAPPHPSEGFSQIDQMPFVRTRDSSYRERAVIVWCDGVLRRSRSGGKTDDEVFAERGTVLRRYQDDGWHVLGLSWQPEIADKAMSVEQVRAGFARMQKLLGLEIEVEYCPHAAGPPVCWCRKPLPGLGVVFIERHRLDPSRCIYVGAGPQDPGFARRLGFQYQSADEFFRRRQGFRLRQGFGRPP